MNQHQWQSLIVAAASSPDTAQLESLAAHLAECEIAKSILRAKGWGKTGSTIDVMVRNVPHARD